MTEFCLRTRRSQLPGPSDTLLLDWFSASDASTIQTTSWLDIGVPTTDLAKDFLRLAAGIYCADRVTLRPGTWTRSFVLRYAVHKMNAWSYAVETLAPTISFLSGDDWTMVPCPTDEPDSVAHRGADSVDAVCLFSGGLDSLTGAVDLLAAGARVCLVSHYESGQAPRVQTDLLAQLIKRFGPTHIVLRSIFLRPAPAAPTQLRPLPTSREPSSRSRSLLFVAAGLCAAGAYRTDVPLYIPENGFIGINVPLTPARQGSLSTRTTHPHFMAAIAGCIQRLGFANPIVNPFRLSTKGEILAGSRDPEVIATLARRTLSCAHPEAARFARRRQGNCGYCFPCLIRRAALHKVGLDEPGDYSFDVLHEDAELVGQRGSDLRALLRSLNRVPRLVDVLRNGPVQSAELQDFFRVYERGREEVLAWIRAKDPSPRVAQQLPS